MFMLGCVVVVECDLILMILFYGDNKERAMVSVSLVCLIHPKLDHCILFKLQCLFLLRCKNTLKI